MLNPKMSFWPKRTSCTLKSRIFIALCVFSFGTLAAQPTAASLKRLGTEYLLPENAPVADSLAGVFADSLWAFIQIKDNYGKTLPEVRNLSVQLPDDQSFALYSWAVPGEQGGFTFHGFLWNPAWKGAKRMVLEDYGTEEAPYRWLKGGQWVGGICYDILTTKSRGTKHYTLLTFRPGRSYHTKYVDAIELGSKRERMHFGSRIFNVRYNGDERYARRPYRLQFRYNSSLSASVRWDRKHKGIMCDHLAPSKPELVERWFAYGPDFSYDRLYWEKGKWHLDEAYPLIQNIEVAPTNGRVPTSLDPSR